MDIIVPTALFQCGSGDTRMVGKVRVFVEKHIVADVPVEFSACLDCGAIQCSNEKWETCLNRLARAEELKRLDMAATQSPAELPTPETDTPQ
jgi:hypothetical protein